MSVCCKTELTKDGELILTVESTLTLTTCRRCGRTITERYGVDEPRLLRHLPILGRVVYLRIRPKRFRCPFCDSHPTTQTLDWYDPNALHTKAYERHLIVQFVNFHVARHYRDAVDTLRKQEVRRLKQGPPKEAYSDLKHTLWPFRKWRATTFSGVSGKS